MSAVQAQALVFRDDLKAKGLLAGSSFELCFTLTRKNLPDEGLIYKQIIIIRNPRKVGFSGFTGSHRTCVVGVDVDSRALRVMDVREQGGHGTGACKFSHV